MAVRQPEAFPILLKRYRTAAGLTQEALAERATLSVRAISDLERGINRAPHRATVDLLVAALDLPQDAREELERSVDRQRGAYRMVSERAAPATHNLPETLTPLVGRDADVAEIVHRLRWSGTRLLTITGPGGVGKTRVAIAAARALQHDAADGLLYVPLAPLRDARLVAATLTQALDLRSENGRSVEDTLVAALRQRDIFLVLDNLEHVTQAGHLLSRVLQESPHSKLLVTSRAALRITGEQRFELAPLEVPGQEQLSSLQVAARYPAVELFVQRARAVKRGFELTETNLPAVVDICSHLDGLPLAIELAAARINLLTPQALLPRLDQRLRVLTEGAADLPDRQRTMVDAIAWSYYLLDSRGQALFRRLSVFAGGWTLDAVESVAADGGGGTIILGELTALVDSSIIQAHEGSDGNPRYTMLETVREYGLDRLEAAGDLEQAQEAHFSFFLQLAECASRELTGKDASVWLARLREEEDNLRAALHWLGETGRIREGVQFTGAIWRFWYTGGAFTEGRGWLSTFLERDSGAGVEPGIRARALFGLGALAYSQSDYDTARLRYEESLALQQTVSDVDGIATVLNGLGVLETVAGDYARAERFLRECVDLRRGGGDRFGLAAALNNLANAVKYRGDLPEAAVLYKESLAVYDSIGSHIGADATLVNLGQLMLLLGEYEASRRFSEQSLELARALGRQFSVAQAQMDLGNLALELGDLQDAEERYGEALELYQAMGDRTSAGTLIANQANLARARRDYRRARELALESLRMQREQGDERNTGVALLYLGDIAREQGKYDEATEQYRGALQCYHEIGFLVGVAECLEHLGWLAAPRGAERGATILGAADSARASLRSSLTPAERIHHDRAVSAIREALGEDAVADAWGRGRAMDRHALIADILNGAAVT